MAIFIRMFYTAIDLSESYTYYNIIFKDISVYIYKNVLYIIKLCFY